MCLCACIVTIRFSTSTFSPTAIVELARSHGMSAGGLDRTHGAAEFCQSRADGGHQTHLRVEISVNDTPLLLYRIRAGYHNLCRLLSYTRNVWPPMATTSIRGKPTTQTVPA